MPNDKASELVKIRPIVIPFTPQNIPQYPASQNPGGIICFRFQRLSLEPLLVHGVFARQGGASAPPYSSLNTGYSTGDDPRHVRENLSAIQNSMGGTELLFLDQVHGRDILVLHKEESDETPEGAKADAAITDRKSLVVIIKQADCQSIILYDPKSVVMALVHCGWRGNVQNILASVVDRMVSDFHCSRSRLLAGVGPSLGPCCAEFKTYREIFPEDFRTYMVRENCFDLWRISRSQLVGAGLKDENIEVAGLCNACRTDLFFSYRRERTTGRFATAAMLV